MDWRLRPLALVVKLWAQFHSINSAKEMTISSYSLVLMVIHFLQCAVNPAVLPCLHEMYPNKFQVKKLFFLYSYAWGDQFSHLQKPQDIRAIDMNEDLNPYFSQNNQPLGELFLQFFDYYTHFKYTINSQSNHLLFIWNSFSFSEYAISVRTASVLSIEECRRAPSPKNDQNQWKELCIEGKLLAQPTRQPNCKHVTVFLFKTEYFE